MVFAVLLALYFELQHRKTVTVIRIRFQNLTSTCKVYFPVALVSEGHLELCSDSIYYSL